MADFGFIDLCRFNATSSGTGDFVVSSAVTDHFTPAQAGAYDGKSYHYFARNATNTEFEEGWGNRVVAGDKILRTTIVQNSLGTTSKIDFTSIPIVDVFPSPTALEVGFPAGTEMVFWQAAAPLGWTKQTTHNDKALRVVSGSSGGGYGGSYAFSTVFGRYQTDSHAIDSNELTYHLHGYYDYYGSNSYGTGYGNIAGGGVVYVNSVSFSNPQAYEYTSYAGANYGHVHGVEMRVQYLDVIICSKD